MGYKLLMCGKEAWPPPAPSFPTSNTAQEQLCSQPGRQDLLKDKHLHLERAYHGLHWTRRHNMSQADKQVEEGTEKV